VFGGAIWFIYGDTERRNKTKCWFNQWSACNFVGYMYDEGRHGVPENNVTAQRYYQKACDGQYYTACYNLGRLYEDGEVEPSLVDLNNEDRSFWRLYHKACKGGDGAGCARLAHYYSSEERGKIRNVSAANDYYRSACSLGHFSSCVSVGDNHLDGNGTERDVGLARENYATACRGDDQIGCQKLRALKAEEPEVANLSTTVNAQKAAERPVSTVTNPYARFSKHPAEALDKVLASHRFLARLRTLMEGYEPDLSETPTIDFLGCTTEAKRSQSSGVATLYRTLEEDKKKLVKEHNEIKKQFYKHVYPLQFRIDPDWKEAKGGLRLEHIHGCYLVGAGWTNEGLPCKRGGEWRLRALRMDYDQSAYTYSAKLEPQEPVLMQKMADHDIVLPAWLHCLVRDVGVTPSKHACYWPSAAVVAGESKQTCKSMGGTWKRRLDNKNEEVSIACAAPDASLSFNVMLRCEDCIAGVAELRVGDVIRMPITINQPGKRSSFSGRGVIVGNFSPASWSEVPAFQSWTIRGYWGAVNVLHQNAQCADDKAIARAICRSYDRRPNKHNVIKKCVELGAWTELNQIYEHWKQARHKYSNSLLEKACQELGKDSVHGVPSPTKSGMLCAGDGEYTPASGFKWDPRGGFRVVPE